MWWTKNDERESSKWIDKKWNEMKWTHYCRCPLKWTCTQPTSVAIKQLKASIFSKWYMAHLTVGIIEFPTLCWCCCCLKARLNRYTTFYIKLFVANGLWRSSFEFLFKLNEHRMKKRERNQPNGSYFFSIALCFARSTCHSKTIISSCKWATKSETNGESEREKNNGKIHERLHCFAR